MRGPRPAVFPAILNFAGVIWKDVQLAAAWAFVLGAAYARHSRGVRLGAPSKGVLLMVLCYGALARHNAGLVAAPLVLYVVFARPWLSTIWKTLAAYASLVLCFVVLGHGVNVALHADKTPVVDTLRAFDLAGITLITGHNVYPFALDKAEMDTVGTCYANAETADPLVFGQCNFIWSKVAAISFNDKDAMRRAWSSAVVQNPLSYLRHRLKHFGTFLAVTTNMPPKTIWQAETSQNKFGFETHKHGLYHVLFGYISLLSGTFVFRPVTWLVISLVLLIAPLGSPIGDQTWRFVATTGVISSAYLLTYLPFGVASDFRYAYPSIIATTFGLCAILCDWLDGLRLPAYAVSRTP